MLAVKAKNRRGAAKGQSQTVAAAAKKNKTAEIPSPPKKAKVMEEKLEEVEEEEEVVAMEEEQNASDDNDHQDEPMPEVLPVADATTKKPRGTKKVRLVESKRKTDEESPVENQNHPKSRKKFRVEEKSADSNNNRTLNSLTPSTSSRARARPSLPASLNISTGRGSSTLPKLKIQPSPTESGTLYTLGMNTDGQLGIVTANGERKFPALVVKLEGIPMTQVCAGSLHTVALSATGQVYTFGCNDERALGRDGDMEDDENPTQGIPGLMEFPKDQRVVQISAGDCHTALLTESGHVYGCGLLRSEDGDKYGLIPGEAAKVLTPKRIYPYPKGDLVIVKIASGINHLVLLSADGDVYTCGDNELGQLGRVMITRSTRQTAAQIPGEFNLQPAKVNIKKRIVDIWAGGNMTFMKTDKGEIWACGINTCGQLGMERRIPKERFVIVPRRAKAFNGKDWKQLAPAKDHVLAIDADGKAYALGYGRDGQLGIGDNTPTTEPYTVREPVQIHLPNSDTLKCIQVAAGNESSFAIMEDFKIYGWGFGDNLQLGNGTRDTKLVPTLCNGKIRKTGIRGKVIFVGAGYQHTAIIVQPDPTPEDSDSD